MSMRAIANVCDLIPICHPILQQHGSQSFEVRGSASAAVTVVLLYPCIPCTHPPWFTRAGSIADIEPRASLGKYLNVHMLLGFFQIVMAAVGLGLLTYLRSTCRGLLKDQALHILLAVIVASQVRAWL